MIEVFEARLAKYLNLKLELVINENRSTMLNLLEKKRDRARLSVHKMFLDAPDEVVSAIAHYVRGTRKGKSRYNLILRSYIQEHLSQYDYSHLVDKMQLTHEGEVYNLKSLYDEINEKYFQDQLDLSLTWYGAKGRRRGRSRITFGQYLDGLRLIKIHRMLDDAFFPDYFVMFIVYHEMLHCVIPGEVKGGTFRFHSRNFREQEKRFEHYQRAIDWEKKNKHRFFKRKWGIFGRP